MANRINSIIFSAFHSFLNKDDLRLYHQLIKNQEKSFEVLQQEQNMHLKNIIEFAYEHVPYYTKLFKQLGLIPSDIQKVKDLEHLPVLTKKIIREQYNEFIATGFTGKYFQGATGGSTGEPLRYRIGALDRALGFGLSYRGWNYGGYEPGDSLLVLGGGSIVSAKMNFKKKLYHRIKNHYIASSYGMDDDYLHHLTHLIDNKKIKFIRGYASSVSLLASWLKDKSISQKRLKSVKAIFTTAEMLYPQQRKIIEEVFDAKVYDGYGLNDGGISAYESGRDEGYLIDTERAVMECVDEKEKQITSKPGRIIATNLFNYPMPFIRYDTGDIGIISDVYLQKGGNRLILKNLLGRTTDYLEINNKKIGSPVLTVLMSKINARHYQFIQHNADTLEIMVEKDEHYGKADEKLIRESIINHVGSCEIIFNYGKEFRSSDNKHKFIIRDF